MTLTMFKTLSLILLLCVLITIPFRLFVHPEPHTYLTMTIDVISFW